MSVRPAAYRVQRTRAFGCARPALPMAVVPATSGIHFRGAPKGALDARVRANDGVMKVITMLEGCK